MDSGDKRSVEILLIEDNLGDARLTMEALKESKTAITFHHVEDGAQALSFLRKQAPYEDAPLPDIILLDLNLPKLDGRGVLTEIRADANLCHIPVIALTTSVAQADIDYCYEHHVNAYMPKRADFEDFLEALKQFQSFWFSAALLPSSGIWPLRRDGHAGDSMPIPAPPL